MALRRDRLSGFLFAIRKVKSPLCSAEPLLPVTARSAFCFLSSLAPSCLRYTCTYVGVLVCFTLL